MDRSGPLGPIKEATTGTLSKGVALPFRLAARTFGVARGAASIGWHVARDLAGRDASAPVATEPGGTPDRTEPVNVVEELGLDPAPVDGAAPAGEAEEPVTSIDAQADPDAVDVTPADVAERISSAPEPRNSE